MKEKTSDILVIGAGAWGLAAAYGALRAGRSVRILEAGQPGIGASGGLVGALSPHVPDQWNPKKQFQFEALDAGQQFWRRIAEISELPTGYGRLGRIVPIKDEASRDLAELRAQNASTLWQGVYQWQVLDQIPSYLSPLAAPFGAVHETLSARLEPRLAIAALSEAVRALGGDIVENQYVETILEGAVTTAQNTYLAERIFVASGLNGIDWMSALIGKRAGGGVKGQAALLKINLGPQPQIFDDGIYIIPHDGGQTAIGSTSENTWEHGGTDERLDDLITRAIAICPELSCAQVLERWASLRPKAKRRDPMLGPVPGFDRVYAVLGGFKIGLGLMPKIADLMAEFAVGKHPDLPESFRVTHHLQ